MQQTKDTRFENLSERRCLIIGDAISINSETLNLLLMQNFDHIYLVNSKVEIVEHITSIVSRNSFTVSNFVLEINLISKTDICIIGFLALPNDLFKLLKRTPQNILVFFEEGIGSFKSLWHQNFKAIVIIEQPLSVYFAQKNNLLLVSEKLDKTIPDFFTNRGNEIDAYRSFALSTRYRAAKIVGLDGIGKKAFLNYLKTYHNFDQNCFDFFFTSNDNTAFDVISELGKYLSVKVVDKEISMLKKNNNPSSILRLFDKFDKIENGKIVFKNVDLVYNLVANDFYDKQLSVFFHNLITRNSFAGNRIYFVSNCDLTMPDFQSEDLCRNISLPPINSRFIKIIMEREFIQKSQLTLASRVMQLNDDTLIELIGGHPHIAKMFVKACDNASIDTIINDENFRKRFENDKVKYLFGIIQSKSNTKAVECLNYLSCVSGPFEKELIETICGTESAEIINYLRSSFFLEVEHHENKSESYEIPVLIKKIVRSQIPKSTYKSTNNFLGEFYWKMASDFNSNAIKIIKGYRYSEYHFKESENLEMQIKLVRLFKEKYLQKANQLYAQQNFRDAYFFYKELYDSDYISDNTDANFFIVCCIKTNAADTEKYILRALSDFPASPFIMNTVADYYYKKERFDEAFDLVSKSLDVMKGNHAAISLYYKILGKIGRENEAFEFYDKKLTEHLNPKLNEKEKRELVRELMNYFQILNGNELAHQLTKNITQSLSGGDQVLFTNYLNSNIEPGAASKISEAYRIALTVKNNTDNNLRIKYNKYIDRQKNVSIVDKDKLNVLAQNQASLLKKAFSDTLNITVARINKCLQIIKIIKQIDHNDRITKLALPNTLINQYNLNLISNFMKAKTADSKVKIVFTSASPDGEARLRLDREFRAIDKGLQAAKERAGIELSSKWALRLPDFTKAMLDYTPQIIHFSGHGNHIGLAFESNEGVVELINKEGLHRLFSLFKDSLSCVVLNACYSQEIAKTISEHDIYVVGMSDEILDDAAIKFSVGFYQAYGAGRSIEDAFQMGLVHVSVFPDNKDTPTLWKNGIQI